jgi:hypothetical protein
MGAAMSMSNWDRWLAVGVAAAVGLAAGLADASQSGGHQLAYVDPGAGSFILQALVAALAGIVVTLNLYWRKIKGLFGFGSDSKKAENSTGVDAEDD